MSPQQNSPEHSPPPATEHLPDAAHLEALRRALESEAAAPPPTLLQNLRDRVLRTPQLRRLPRWVIFGWGAVLVLACLLILWSIWRPAVTLEWQAPGSGWQAFRVYRAPAGTENYHLVAELPVTVSPPDAVYTFADRSAIPGVDYAYRVEGVKASGTLGLSEPVIHQGTDTLLQVGALVLFSLSLGLLGVSLLPRGIPGRPPAVRQDGEGKSSEA